MPGCPRVSLAVSPDPPRASASMAAVARQRPNARLSFESPVADHVEVRRTFRESATPPATTRQPARVHIHLRRNRLPCQRRRVPSGALRYPARTPDVEGGPMKRVLAIVLALIALLAVPGGASAKPHHGDTRVQLLAINDLHGHLQPSTPGSIQIGCCNPVFNSSGVQTGWTQKTVPAGGIAIWPGASRRYGPRTPNSITVGAGDMIGASRWSPRCSTTSRRSRR